MVESSHPRLSVVIPTRNREDVLGECLTRLSQQAESVGLPLEVIVIDTSTHKTVLAYDKSSWVALEHHYEGDRPFSLIYARNRGLSLAHADIVAYIDDDCFVLPGWLDALLEPYESPRTIATGGRIIYHPWHTAKFGEPVAQLELARDVVWAEWDRIVERPIVVSHLPGGNFSVLRLKALEIGGFDPQFTGSANLEETDFFIRLGKLGGDIIFTSDAAVEHRAAPRTDGIVRSAANFVYRKSAVRNRLYLLRKHAHKDSVRMGTSRQIKDLTAGFATLVAQAIVFAAASMVGIVEGLIVPIASVERKTRVPLINWQEMATKRRNTRKVMERR